LVEIQSMDDAVGTNAGRSNKYTMQLRNTAR